MFPSFYSFYYQVYPLSGKKQCTRLVALCALPCYNKNMLKIFVIWLLAALFTANSLSITLRANLNAGVLMMWVVSLGLILYGIFHKPIDQFCQQGFGCVLKYIFFAGLALFAGLFVFVAISGYSDRARGDEKALVVLGAGIRGETVGDVLRRRLVATLEAWQENPGAVIVVTGGQGYQEVIPEAVAMQRWLLARGVPKDKIIVEDKSTSTQENLTFAGVLLKNAGISKDAPIAIVTNAFHGYRARSYAEKLGYTDVRTVPASIGPTIIMAAYMREVLAVLFMWVFRRQLAD